MSEAKIIDRLREMFGIEATDTDAVFDALDRYDIANHRVIERLQSELDEARAERDAAIAAKERAEADADRLREIERCARGLVRTSDAARIHDAVVADWWSALIAALAAQHVAEREAEQ